VFVFHPHEVIIPWGFLSLALASSKSVKWNRNCFEDGFLFSPSLSSVEVCTSALFCYQPQPVFLMIAEKPEGGRARRGEPARCTWQCCPGVGLRSYPRAHIHHLQPCTLSSASSLQGLGWAAERLHSPPSRLLLPKTCSTASKVSQVLWGERRVLGGSCAWMEKLWPPLSLQWD